METFWSISGYVLLCLIMLAGLVLTILNLPGNWVILGCAVAYGFATQWSKFGWVFIAWLAAAAPGLPAAGSAGPRPDSLRKTSHAPAATAAPTSPAPTTTTSQASVRF